MLNPRLQIILRELMATKIPITGEYLANLNQVTGRTIRSDVKELNATLAKNGASILSLSGKGYTLEVANENLFRIFLQTLATEKKMDSPVVPDSQEERAVFLVNRLLLAEDYVKLDELADELYVSKSTVENDFKQAKTVLTEYGIHLEKRPNYGLKAIGDEVKIRFCLAEYLFDDQRDKSALITQFTSLDTTVMSRISAIIMEQIECYQIVLSDIAVNNLVIHIAIAYKRMKSGYQVSLPHTDLKSIEGQKEYQVAKAIVQKVEATFNIDFPQAEVAYIAIHLLGTKLLTKTNSSGVMSMVDEFISHLVELVLDRIETELNLGIKEDRELTIALSLHLKPAINRYQYGMNVRNPMLQDIKTNYPLAFEAGVIAGLAIKKETGIEINENEVGYLALHIGAAIERRKLKSGPKRCLIVCASGLGTARLIYYRLKNYFGKSLEIAGTTEYYQLSGDKLGDIDFIVSSIPIEQELPVQVVEVNAILGESDLRRIEKVVADEQEGPNHYFHEELLFLRQSFDSKEAVLQFFQDVLLEKGLVDNTLLDAIYEREEVAPTSYGNMVAIPHPIRPKSEETFLAVCTLEKPIDWNGNPVQFICLLSVKKDSQEDLQSMYEMLGNIVDSPEVVQDLVKARTLREFLDVLR